MHETKYRPRQGVVLPLRLKDALALDTGHVIVCNSGVAVLLLDRRKISRDALNRGLLDANTRTITISKYASGTLWLFQSSIRQQYRVGSL